MQQIIKNNQDVRNTHTNRNDKETEGQNSLAAEPVEALAYQQ